MSVWLRLVVALMLVLTLGACGEATEDDAAQPSPGGTPAEAAEAGDQTLTVATPGDVYITRDRVMLAIWPDNPNVCETLVKMTPDFQTAPGLATEWEYVGDNTFRFTLREGVQFHNGEPFDAEAVQHSMQRVVEVDHTLSTGIEADSVEIIDDHTVEITPSEENLRLPSQLVHNFFAIVAPGTDPAEEPVCTGPFQFEEYEPNDRLVVSRFDDYWGEPARLDEMTFRFIDDPNARRLALESGDVDLIYDLPLQQVPAFQERDGFQVAVPPPGAVYTVSMNLHGSEPHTILQDENVRRALAMSFDEEAIAEDLFQGIAEPVNTVSPPSLLGEFSTLVEGISHNPSGAEQLLEEAGWAPGGDGIREKGGRRLTLVTAAQFDVNRELLQFLQAQAREVGIELELELAPDASAYSERIDAGQFDLDVNYFNQNDANPARIVSLFWYSRRDSNRVQLTGPGGEFDDLIEQSQAAESAEEAARFAAEAMSVLVDETASAIPLTSFPFAYGLKDTVAGFDPHPSVNDMEWTEVHRTR